MVVDGECSRALSVLSGVFLGSVLDPLLILIFFDDVVAQVSQLSLFADDMVLYRPPIDYSNLQHDIALWIKTWSTSLQPKKCCAMVLEIRPETLFQRLVVGLQRPFEHRKSSQPRKKKTRARLH